LAPNQNNGETLIETRKQGDGKRTMEMVEERRIYYRSFKTMDELVDASEIEGGWANL